MRAVGENSLREVSGSEHLHESYKFWFFIFVPRWAVFIDMLFFYAIKIIRYCYFIALMLIKILFYDIDKAN